jgi:excinuclease UvrABC nuclease subunit
VGRADRDHYRDLVNKVTTFLSGEPEVLRQEIWRGLEAAAERLDFEKARRLRDDLVQAEALSMAQARLQEADRVHTLLLVLPSSETKAREILLVIRGQLWSQVRADREAGAESLAMRLKEIWNRAAEHSVPSIDYDTIDEANILNRWLFRFSDHPAILPIAEPPDWPSLASNALSLSDAELEFKIREVDTEIDDVLAETTVANDVH